MEYWTLVKQLKSLHARWGAFLSPFSPLETRIAGLQSVIWEESRSVFCHLYCTDVTELYALLRGVLSWYLSITNVSSFTSELLFGIHPFTQRDSSLKYLSAFLPFPVESHCYCVRSLLKCQSTTWTKVNSFELFLRVLWWANCDMW